MFRKSEYSLHGEKVLLVPYIVHHVPKYNKWMQNKELQLLTASEPLTLEKEYAMQQSWMKDDNKCTFIVLDKELLGQGQASEIDAMVGDVNLFLMEPDSEEESAGPATSAEVEVMIAEPSSRGKGLAQETVKLMLSYGHQELGIQKFQAKIGKQNVASLSLFTNKLLFKEVSASEVFNEVTLELSVEEKTDYLLRKLTWSKYTQLQ